MGLICMHQVIQCFFGGGYFGGFCMQLYYGTLNPNFLGEAARETGWDGFLVLGQFCLLKHVLDKDVHSLHVVTVPMQLAVIHLYIGHFQLLGALVL